MLKPDDALEYDKCTICDKKFEKKHLYLDYDIYGKLRGKLCSNCKKTIIKWFSIAESLRSYIINRGKEDLC